MTDADERSARVPLRQNESQPREVKLRERSELCFEWFALLFVALTIFSGCRTLSRSTPTALPVASSQPIGPTPIAQLDTLQIVVKRLREESVIEVPVDDPVDVQVDDQITVEERGRGLLRFQDRLQVEVFHDTELRLSDAQLDPEGFIFLRLQQIIGSTRTELNEEVDARIRLETDHATITSGDTPGGKTEFVVCHAQPVTCMVTLAGEVEVEAQGKRVTATEGEAVYVFPEEPPRPAICANMADVERWLEAERNIEETDPLGKIVAGWPQEPCEPTSSAAPTPTEAAIPSSEGMVSIEAGRYEIGAVEADDYHAAMREIDLDDFWIDAYEVTNAQYQIFQQATGHAAPSTWPGGIPPAGRENHPVNGITWDAANAYCTWANKRLPDEAEWEVAARGPEPESARYPWGSNPTAGGAVTELSRVETYEVGSQPFNRSHFGVYDMALNVWEWVGQPYAPLKDGHKILRGGRHGFLVDMAYRQQARPGDESFVRFAGFRCASDRVQGG